MFFSYFTSCGSINIHHIHIHNDYLCLSNKLNLCYYHRFPMKHFLHLNKLWTSSHFMSIQTTDVTCIWRCLLCFLTWLCHLCGCHRGLPFLLSTCLHIMICHPTNCAMFVSFPCLLRVFTSTTYLILYGTYSALLIPAIDIPSSHNIVASLCCNVDCCILIVTILRYDCKFILKTILKKLFVVGTCKPWASF